ncbi:hypothetical protein D6D10_08841, partial [Aureobasidium pullulans]
KRVNLTTYCSPCHQYHQYKLQNKRRKDLLNKRGLQHDDSAITAFTDLIQKLTDNEKRSKAKIEELQQQMKKTDERLDIVVDELQTCTLLILRLKRTLAEFVEEHYE